MRANFRSVSAVFGLCVLGGIAVTGCQGGNTVTKEEEAKLKNPSKEMPPEAVQYMKDHGGGGAPPSSGVKPAAGVPAPK